MNDTDFEEFNNEVDALMRKWVERMPSTGTVSDLHSYNLMLAYVLQDSVLRILVSLALTNRKVPHTVPIERALNMKDLLFIQATLRRMINHQLKVMAPDTATKFESAVMGAVGSEMLDVGAERLKKALNT